MAHNQTYFGAHSQQAPSQQYGNYQQRSSTAGAGVQYSAQAPPVSDSYSSYTAPTYAPAANYNYASDYSYSASGYGTGTTSAGAARNNASTDLQQLAYASGLHNTNQRSEAPSPVITHHQRSPSAAQSVQNTRTYPNNSSTSFAAGFGTQQARPKSVNSLAGRTQQRSPALENRHLRGASGLPHPSNYTTQTPTPKPVAQSSSTAHLPSATYAAPHQQVHSVTPTNSGDLSSRQLPTISQVTQTSTATSYNWSGGQQNQENAAETVDPIQIYDPYPDIQRRLEAERAAKVLQERARSEKKRIEQEAEAGKQEELRREEERKAEEQRQAEHRRQAEERCQAEERRQAEEQRQQEEQRQAEERQQAAVAQQQAAQQARFADKVKKKANTKTKMSKTGGAPAPSTVPAPSSASLEDLSIAGEGDESQIRQLMEIMRNLHNKNPTMMAKIWEEERARSHAPPAQMATQSGPVQSPQPQNPPARQAQMVEHRQLTPAAAAQQVPQPTHQIQQVTPTPRPSGPTTSNARKQHQPQMKPSSGNTVWPADKMDQISRAASSFLNAVPENANKQVTSEEICGLLNRKPTYIELCQWLETQGLKFERAIFARALLTAVPDINRAQQPAAAPANTATLPGTVDTAQGRPGAQGNSEPHSNSASSRLQALQGHSSDQRSSYPPPEVAQTSGPYFTPSRLTNDTRSTLATPPPQIAVGRMPHTRHVSGSRQSTGSRETSQKPATKAEAARKRKFSDFIDLTAMDDDDDDDDDLPPAKRQEAAQQHDMTTTWALPPSATNPNQLIQPQSHNAHMAPPLVLAADDRMRNMDVVRPIEKKNALRRSTYDAKTIARDVLLATGKHPEMRPLNGHLEILKESFRNVDNISDLSTLRWDLIDPGEPPADALKVNVIEIDDEDAEDEDEPVQPAQPKARPTPHMVPSNSTLEPRLETQKKFHPLRPAVLNNATPEPSPSASAKRGPGRPRKSTPAKPRDIPIRSTEDPGANARATSRAVPGTPQRDRVLQPGHDHPRTTPRATSNLHSPTMAQGSKSAGALGGYSAFRQQELNPDGTPVLKKRGRPVGWRKAIHSKEAQAKLAGLSPAEYATHLKSTAGAASRSSSVASHRNYSVYQCQWDGCKSELHNMETLRKHVYKFHQAKNAYNKFACFWGDCEENENSVDTRTGKPNGFSVPSDFQDHMEFVHLGPKSWKLGDGPAAGLSESQDSGSEAYLCDETGRQVTPKILPRKRNATEGISKSDSKKILEEKSMRSRETTQRPSEDGYVLGFSS